MLPSKVSTETLERETAVSPTCDFEVSSACGAPITTHQRGEPLDTLARELGVTVATLAHWR